ncbi:hypothetical protein Lal_00028164 [Lupinus albus]|nr:hypothetical protein Lal_00028164 [Lupinus albus]
MVNREQNGLQHRRESLPEASRLIYSSAIDSDFGFWPLLEPLAGTVVFSATRTLASSHRESRHSGGVADREQIQEALTQTNIDESEVSPHDSVGRVMGLDHSRRMLAMGMGIVPTNSYRNTRLQVSDLSHSSSLVVAMAFDKNGLQNHANDDASMSDISLGIR